MIKKGTWDIKHRTNDSQLAKKQKESIQQASTFLAAVFDFDLSHV